MDMNTIISTSMISLIFLIGIVGLIFTLKNSKSLKKVLTNKKRLGEFKNLNLRDTEFMKMSYWTGNMVIYENYIHIEKTGYFHLIVKDKKSSIRKKAMTISFQKCSLDKKDNIIIKGTKHRVFGNSTIEVKISSKNTKDLYRINDLINNLNYIK